MTQYNAKHTCYARITKTIVITAACLIVTKATNMISAGTGIIWIRQCWMMIQGKIVFLVSTDLGSYFCSC